MDYCGPRGIEVDAFYDWSEYSQNAALSWMFRDREICVCGTKLRDWKKDRDAYVAETVLCEGCARVAQEQENIQKSGRRGIQIRMVEPDRMLPLEEQAITGGSVTADPSKLTGGALV